MTYQETIQYLYNSAPLFQHIGGAAYKEGLSNTHTLDAHFGHPHRHFQTIHVAGTNGKGSCAHTLAALLQLCGMKVGLYTSPHLVDFRERIRVNGKMIPQQYVVDFVAEERDFFEPLHPSFFELTTALAFKYFAEVGVDIAVIEVGLGGRLDCTNIITPCLSIITNISLDHTQFLGHTASEIAAEKAGIIKPRVPVVVGETTPDTRHVFKQKAEENESPITFAEEVPEVLASTLTATGLRHYETRSWGSFEGELAGECQVKNTNTLLCAINKLCEIGILPDDDTLQERVHKAFATVCSLTGLMGRWQTISNHPDVVCDTGHNVGGWAYLAHQLTENRYRKVHIIFGMMGDKDVDAVLSLLPQAADYYFTRATVKRSLGEDILQTKAMGYGLKGAAYPDVMTAYHAARAAAYPDDLIYIGGSSFVVADFMTAMQKNDL